MKYALLCSCLLLAGCGGSHEGPKFTNPVVVAADAPIYETTMLAGDELVKGRLLTTARKGDTLEFDGMPDGNICRVKPDARLGKFPHDTKAGYVLKKYLVAPDAAAAKY